MIRHIISGMAVSPHYAFECIFANDSTFGEDNGTIVFKQQADISMDKEVLLISEKQVKVDCKVDRLKNQVQHSAKVSPWTHTHHQLCAEETRLHHADDPPGA